MNIETKKQEIGKLVEKYNLVVEEKRVNKYNEEMTKKDFILPLFRALGWNIEDSNEVSAEEKISKKRVDYGFRINGIPKFFLEAKSLKEDLDNPKFIEQAINYAWHKGCTWAVLTDFEAIKIFNAEWKTSNPLQSHLKTIPCQEFLDRFNELWLLSRESFEQGLIDKEAEKWGKKAKKIPVDKQLLVDFTRFRELLSKNITKLNQNLTGEDLDEAVQRILDRLIFIRNCEDRELEAKTLISSLREWESRGKGQLIKSLREVFEYFDREYNSKIFANHLCDSLEIDNEVLHEVIEGLYYTKDKSVSYDFSAIEADVLGNIYEQYLGHILKKGEKRAKLTESHAHRKEQGIYYTPTYIVDYIVRNTLGELLKDKKVNPEKIRVLDPACGSGSFLIKAFDVLNEHYSKNDKNYSQTQIDFKTNMPFTTKTKILKNNIFGVDLDKQAVEIAQLNLLLKIAEKGQRLPLLQENIKCGNSLIDDPAIAGDKAFKWEEEFKEVMQEGGFDVVIGNPPYVMVTDLNENDKRFFSVYKTSFEQYNIYYLFIERAIQIVKNKGFIGFIVPIGFLNNHSGTNLRKLILEKCRIISIVDVSNLKVFKDASTYPIIILMQREDNINLRNKNTIKIYTSFENDSKIINASQNEIIKNKGYIISLKTDSDINKILLKIESITKPLSHISFNYRGMQINKIKLSANKIPVFKEEYIFPAIHLRNIKAWLPSNPNIFAIHSDKKAGKEKRELFKNEKILIPRFVLKFRAAYSGNGEYILDNIYIIQITSKDILTKYVLGLLNSKLIDFYYRYRFSQTHISGGYFAVNGKQINNLPIKLIPESEQQPLITLVDKMLSLNKRLNEIGDKKTDERARIEEEIKKTDAEIDELVYKLYGITEEEKKIIEESLK